MQVEPAHVSQVQMAGGRLVEVSDDVGGVAADLRQIDPHLKVRFAQNGQPPFFAVYYESDDKRSTYLVLSVQAHQTHSGVWTGLDQRVVERIRQISHPSYDYAAEVERSNRDAEKAKQERRREALGPIHEQAAHAIRKDLGVKKRTFIG